MSKKLIIALNLIAFAIYTFFTYDGYGGGFLGNLFSFFLVSQYFLIHLIGCIALGILLVLLGKKETGRAFFLSGGLLLALVLVVTLWSYVKNA